MTTRRLLATTLVALVAPLAMMGCAAETPPGESVPELSTQLDRIDDAIEDGNLSKARKVTEKLVAQTAVARADGAISKDAANQIFEAAEALLEQLPEGNRTPSG